MPEHSLQLVEIQITRSIGIVLVEPELVTLKLGGKLFKDWLVIRAWLNRCARFGRRLCVVA